VSPLSKDPSARERQLANLRGSPSGEQRALSHGGYAPLSPDELDDQERAIYAELAAAAPVRTADDGLPQHDAMLVTLAAECRGQLIKVSANIRDCGMFVARGKRKGEVRNVVDLSARLRREMSGYLQELGMTTASRAKLGVDVKRAESIADELEAARAAREAREARDRDAGVIDATAVEDEAV
jgi:hypothetical protein